MTDVPEDIREIAAKLASMRGSIALRGFIAQALLTERLAQKERDAKMVEAIGSVGRDWALTSFMGSLRRDIAAAIRQS